MIQIQIKEYKAVKYMVHDSLGPIRGFSTKSEAKEFAQADPEYWIECIPPRITTIDLEEAPF